MIIDVKELKDKIGKTCEYFFQQELRELESTEMLMETKDERAPVNVKVYAFFADNKIYVSGNLKTWITVYCSRCLTPFQQEVGGEFWEEFEITSNPAEEGISEELISQEAADRLLIRGDSLDLSEYIRQLYVVFQDWKPLCYKECKGLCSVCGSNLNEKTCSCHQEGIDPRLAPLMDLQSGNKRRRN